MTRYIAQRVFQALIVLLLVTLITFSILHALPGGAARSALGLDATQAQIDAYNHQMGLRPTLMEAVLRLSDPDLPWQIRTLFPTQHAGCRRDRSAAS